MPLRQAAVVAVRALAVALPALVFAVAVGCGSEAPPPTPELIKGLILLPPGYDEPGTPQPTPLPAALTPAPTPAQTEPTPPSADAAPPIPIAGISFAGQPLNSTQTYYCGDEVKVSFSFEGNVEVIGRPQAPLLVGYAVRYAAFANIAEHDPTTVYFTYTIQEDDRDSDGIVLLGSYLADAGNYIRKQGSETTHNIAIGATEPLHDPGGSKVDGPCLRPDFSENAAALPVSQVVYSPGQIITPQQLPAATGGNGPLTYELIQCAGSDNADRAPVTALFEWLTYRPPGPADDHGGRLLPVGDAAPPAAIDAICFILIAQDADSDTSPVDSARYRFSIAVTGGSDYDINDNGLIEVGSLAQLHAIRYDLDGNGAPDTAAAAAHPDNAAAAYAAAFPNPLDNMGCPTTGCIGYELTQNLNLDTDQNGATYTDNANGVPDADPNDAYYNAGQGWTPIGSPGHPFTATLNGQGYHIANLFIRRDDGGALGLFGAIGSAGTVENLGLPAVRIYYAGAADANVGSIAGRSHGTVSYCYADGAVAGYSIADSAAIPSIAVGGLIGTAPAGTLTGSYANVDVSGGSGSRVGGLVGRAGMNGETIAISASYAAGPVIGGADAGVGGLIGELGAAGRITNSYAVGIVRGGRDSNAGGLIGIRQNDAITTASYYDAGSTGQSDADGAAAAKTTRALQSPTANAGIYQDWNAYQWDFGTNRQYPALKIMTDGSLVPGQRQVSLHVDHWNHPVAGEPVEVILNGRLSDTDTAAIQWQWQSSANGATWTDIAAATDAIYVPAAADAAAGGKYLRAKVSFTDTTAEANRTLTTINTAKVIPATTADAGAIVFTPQPVVGSKLEHQLPAAAYSQAWRWRRCDNAEMTDACIWIADGTAAYILQSDDAGKYFSAYVYYRNSADWHRAETPIYGPVVAAAESASDP